MCCRQNKPGGGEACLLKRTQPAAAKLSRVKEVSLGGVVGRRIRRIEKMT
jgi:hypothetical protein